MSAAFSNARTTTPNLLGRELRTVEDVEAAYEAIAVAQLRRSKMLGSDETMSSSGRDSGSSSAADVLVVHGD